MIEDSPPKLLGTCLLLGSNEGKEHVECNLDTVDEDKTVLGGDELEVNSVDNGPHLPRSLACTEQIVLDLASNGGQRISVNQSEVAEEDTHEDRAPHGLVNGNLKGNILCFGSWDLAVQPVVEVVSRRSVVDETEEGKGKEALHIEGSSADENLGEEVTKSPSNKGCKSLCGQRVGVKCVVVGSPSWDGSSSDILRVAEEGACGSSVPAEGWLLECSRALAHGFGRGDTKGASSEERCCYDESLELHVDYFVNLREQGRLQKNVPTEIGGRKDLR